MQGRATLAVFFLGLAACSAEGGASGSGAEATPPTAAQSSPLAGVPYPADNPTNPAKVELGRLLFWDPILSGDTDVACGSCHDPACGYSDDRGMSVGTKGQRTARGAMSVLDAAWNGRTTATPVPDPTQAVMFWDNRARSLEGQARGPITGASEMRGTSFSEAAIFPEVSRRLREIPEYVERFTAAFGSGTIDETAIVRAIATFERTLVTVPSYQRYLGGEDGALGAAAKRGLATFQRAGCAGCHSGPMLSDYSLHRFTRGGEALRTPSLRNVTRTAPYFDDGRAASLDAVYEVYRRIDRRADPLLDDLRVPDRGDRSDVEAFLGSASDGTYDDTIPSEVPSGLAVGGTQRPSLRMRPTTSR